MTDTAAQSAVTRIIKGRTRDLGGFEVKRVLPEAKQRMVGPFIFFDQMGPARFPAGKGIDVRPHPHIGLATVTFLFEGAMQHRDSLGVDQVIRPGDVNWMTAGHGVVHSERTPDEERASGQTMYGIQTWVALQEEDEDVEPAFHHHPADTLPVFEREGVEFTLILGDAWEHEAPVEVFSPIFYLAGQARQDTALTLDIDHVERAVYLADGSGRIDGQALEPGDMAVLSDGSVAALELSAGSRIMICGGAPLGERKIFWNYVASSAERLDQAKADWAAAAEAGFPEGGRFILPPGETEHIPLPEG